MKKEKPMSMFGKEAEEYEPVENEHEMDLGGEHIEQDATGAPEHEKEEQQLHPQLHILMNKLTEPEEEEPLMPHHVGGIKKNKVKG